MGALADSFQVCQNHIFLANSRGRETNLTKINYFEVRLCWCPWVSLGEEQKQLTQTSTAHPAWLVTAAAA